jgi:hypothetical protein
MPTTRTATALTDYVSKNPGFQRAFDSYEPNLALIDKIVAALPEARLVVIAEYWCGDSRRLTPRMARIAEHLTGWTVEVLPWDGTTRNKPWLVRAIPTFVVYEGDVELGRIVENPRHGSLEEDLLAIVSK